MRTYDILFAVIAMREVVFFSNIAKILTRSGYKIGFITFYEPGDEYLEKMGYDVFSVHKFLRAQKSMPCADFVERLEQDYGIDNLRDMLLHEKVTFNRYDEEKLLLKANAYFNFFSDLFSEIQCRYVVQELGGFIAPLTLFRSCLKHKIDHVFLEPAMFKGRLFFTLNKINCDIRNAATGLTQEDIEKVNSYILEYNQSKTVVIPKKDVHHFMDATINKLVNKDNVTKLKNKLVNKYVKGLSEEYDAIGNHVKRYVKMYFNRKQLDGFYKKPDTADKFVYYPFHVPLDFQLTVRSNEYLDQIALLKYISNVLPHGWYLYVKEHPAAIGAYERGKMMELLVNQNVKLIHPSVNSYDIISRAGCVITINSKVGAEALMQQKKVLVLGDTFYRGQGLTKDIACVQELRKALVEVLRNPTNLQTAESYMQFFYRVYGSCYPGELYVNSEKNLQDFAESLLIYFESIGGNNFECFADKSTL